MKAGPFRIINTGGFDHATMLKVKKVVEDAAEHMRNHGFEAVLYGDISISNTVMQKNWAAFYYPQHDDMFVRANIAGFEKQATRTVIHELAHRYDTKVMKRDDAVLKRLYAKVAAEDRAVKRSEAQRQVAPSPGTRYVSGGTEYEVMGMSSSTWPVVKLKRVDDPNRFAVIPLADYLANTRTTPRGGFVTTYARKGKFRENFAEMVAFYCLDQLPETQVVMLEDLLKTYGHKPGRGKTAGASQSKPAKAAKPAKVAKPSRAAVKAEAKALFDTLGYWEAARYATDQSMHDTGDHWVSMLTALIDLKNQQNKQQKKA